MLTSKKRPSKRRKAIAALPKGVKVSARQDPKARRWLAGKDITVSGGCNTANATSIAK
jgi:hypothetical protein